MQKSNKTICDYKKQKNAFVIIGKSEKRANRNIFELLDWDAALEPFNFLPCLEEQVLSPGWT